MVKTWRMAMVALIVAGGGMLRAQPPALGHTPALLIEALAGGTRLAVTTAGFPTGGDMPIDATLYGANRFPGLAWSSGPAGTRSYAVIVQGAAGPAPGAGGPTSIHLTLYDLPAGTTSLPAGLAMPPAGARYGPNVHGAAEAYSGPHTHGPAKHAYHFQVFALDRTLAIDGAPSFEAILAAMRGHVLAAGEVVGLAAMPAGADAAVASRPAVRIDTGLVGGVPGRDPSVTVYKGLPFAAPPVGPLRFRPPAPAASWQGLRIADTFGPSCPQPAGAGPPGPMSEDCLTLNIWTGAAKADEKRPVLVWIYGGGFIGGTGSSADFDGEGLARKGVIVVTFNYRVGALGFLATPELSKESGHNASGNYGLLDDIAALKWVRRNIAAFGGDPAKVTIAGQSAGAGSVGFLTWSPLARGLFRAGIAESHSRDPGDPALRFLSVSYRPKRAAEAAGASYAAAHGAHDPAELRALPWQTLIEGSNMTDDAVDTGSAAKPPLFRPVVDGWVVPRPYRAALDARAQAQVTIVTGNNRDETGAVPETAIPILRNRHEPPRAGSPEISVTLADYVRVAHRKYGPMADEFLRLYPATTDDEAARASNAAAQDNNRVSTYLWAIAWSRGSTRPVYTYWWTHAPPGPGAELRGAYHGSEINYVFGNLYAVDRPWSDEDRAIADRMSSYWANIIKTGDPNGPDLPRWPAFAPAGANVMRLGDQWRQMPVAPPEKIDFWKRFFAHQVQW